MKLDEAIDAVRAAMPKHRAIETADMYRPRPDYADRAIATILNAVLDGSLIREAEARGMERAAAMSCSCGYDVPDNVTFDEAQMFRAGAEAALDAVSAMLRAEAAAIRGEGK